MFWKKRKETNVSRNILLIESHLSIGMPLVVEKLANPAAKVAVQLFILGMADMLRQAEKLSWEEYVSICRILFDNHNLQPSNGIEDFIEKVIQVVNLNEEVARMMRYGAQSIETYVVEKDTNAPMDLLSVAMFAENNESKFIDI